MKKRHLNRLENSLTFITILLIIEVLAFIGFAFYEVFVNSIDFHLMKTECLIAAIFFITFIIGATIHDLIQEIHHKNER